MQGKPSQPSSRRCRRTPSSVDEPTIVAAGAAGMAAGDSAKAETARDRGKPAPYQIHEVIGQGGLSLVHRGWQRSLEREVAIKIAHGDRLLAHRAAGQALRAEARIAAQLDHPGVLPMHDLQWLDEDTPMLVMRRIHGETWSDRRESLSRQEHAAILMQVAQVMRYAHDQGVIHRDLKPANVLLGAYGEVLVIDWGMALDRSDYADPNQPWPGGVSGTPQYISPEAAREQRPSPSMDIYGLGALLFKALTGLAPHPFGDIAQALEHARAGLIADHPDPQSDDLLQVALRAMAPQAKDRYASVDALCSALSEAISHEEARRLILKAEADFLAAADSDHAYQDYQRAIFRYQEAQQLWPGNSAIIAALAQTREAYAQSALKHGDLDLAASIVVDIAEPSPDLVRRIEEAQADRHRMQRETERAQKRSLWIQAFLLDVLAQSGYHEQGPDVSLTKALQHCSSALRDRNHANPEDRIDVRLAVLQSINEPHLVKIRQVLLNDIDADLKRMDSTRLDAVMENEITAARTGILIDQGKYSEALPYAEAFWTFVIEENGSDDIVTLTIAYDMLTTCLLNSGQSRASATMLTEYLSMVERSAEHMSPEYRRGCRRNIFSCLVRCGELERAEQLGLDLLQESAEILSEDRHVLLMNMIFLFLDQGRWQEAQSLIDEAYAWRSKRFGSDATPALHVAIMQQYVQGLLGDVSAHRQAADLYAQLSQRSDSTAFNCLEPRCRLARLQQVAGEVAAAEATLTAINSDLADDHGSEDASWLRMLAELVQARQYVVHDDAERALQVVLQAAHGLDQHFGSYDGRSRRARVILAEIAAWAEHHHHADWQAWYAACTRQQRDLLQQGCSDRQQYPGLTVA